MLLRWIILISILLLPVKAAHIEMECLEGDNVRHYELQFPSRTPVTSPLVTYIAKSLWIDFSACWTYRIAPAKALTSVPDARWRYELAQLVLPHNYTLQLNQVLNRFDAWRTEMVRYPFKDNPPASDHLVAYLERLTERVPFWSAYPFRHRRC